MVVSEYCDKVVVYEFLPGVVCPGVACLIYLRIVLHRKRKIVAFVYRESISRPDVGKIHVFLGGVEYRFVEIV